MKADVLALINMKFSKKRPSKETLNHPGIIYLASGIDPFSNTPEAYIKAYEALGIDIINRVPDHPAPKPLEPGETKEFTEDYWHTYLGVYDTFCRKKYPYSDSDEFFADNKMQLEYDKLITPVPHRLDKKDIEKRERLIGDIGVYYYQIYTTLFMWGVEYLGWEVFLMAALSDPGRFKEKFLDQAFEKSLKLIKTLIEVDCPFVFCHDDLASVRGPIFDPSWYDEFIIPRYKILWEPVKTAGKKVVFVADGNMEVFLKPLRDIGVDGIMLESPATNFDLILEHFADKIIIGGIDTKILTFGTDIEIKRHVYDVHEKTKDLPGFVMSSCGGLHGNIPLENLEVYFDTRVETGHTLAGWRNNRDS